MYLPFTIATLRVTCDHTSSFASFGRANGSFFFVSFFCYGLGENIVIEWRQMKREKQTTKRDILFDASQNRSAVVGILEQGTNHLFDFVGSKVGS